MSYQESDGYNDAPRESEHRDAPIGHAAGPFDEDGHDTFTIVRPTANNQDGRNLNDVNDHEPPKWAHDVIKVVNDGNPQLNKFKKKKKRKGIEYNFIQNLNDSCC